MTELLSELRAEASHLSSKSLSPIGFDYRGRTKLERLLFLIAKEYCKEKFNFDLGGLSYSHQKIFREYTEGRQFLSEDVGIVSEAFKISELIRALASSDPYVQEDALEELGGTVYAMFKNLGDKIGRFVAKVEKSYLAL